MSSFSIRNFLNKTWRTRPTQSGSTQGGATAASGPSATTPTAASGPSSTAPTAASGPSSTTPTAASAASGPSSATPTAASGPSSTTPTPTAASGPSSTTPTAASSSSSPYQGIIPPTLPPFPLIPCHDTVGKDAAVEEVCSFLKEVDVGIVGIYGMGGVGKTGLMKIVHNKFLVGCDFDFILWVVVSKEWNYERIRKGIFRMIRSGPLLSNDDVDAMELYNLLLSKRFVLLLDDVWEHLDLMELGIPFPTKTNMCKIIFTTRSEDVCQQMRTDKKIKIDCLGPNDSWALFEKNVGEKALKSHTRVAHQVMKECCGLPLALIIVGRAMSSKYALKEWEHALEILQNNPYQMPGVEKKLFSCLKFSYLSLEDKTSRKCFLYCSLFPEGFSIQKEKLIDYWIGEGFLGKCENIEQLRNKGYHIIGGLLAACLIENGKDEEGKEAVKMHDVIRDMALWIVSDHGVKQNRFFVHPGHRLTFSEINDRWNAAERIFVWDFTYLPNSPSCLELTTLIFRKCYNRTRMRHENVESDGSGISEKQTQIKGKVPLSGLDLGLDPGPSVSPRAMGMPPVHDLVTSLFHFMPTLRLLDLSSFLFGDLPKSVTALSKLRYLSSEGVDYLPHEVGRMSSLEILDIRGFLPPAENSTLFFSLQETVGQLLALRMLSLKSMWFKSLPQNIELLCKLEILDLTHTYISVLPSAIVGLRELRQLLLGGTCLSHLPEKVVYLSKLEVLDLSCTLISVLPSKIDRLSKLRLLNLKGTLLKDLPKDIFYLSMLKVLNLSASVRIKELPNINPSLSNSWRDKFGKTLASAHSTDTDMTEVTKLETVDLSFTSIVILPNFIGKLVELRHLNLKGTLICTLPENVMMLTKLEVLNLNSTKIKELPTSINQLQQLRELGLYNTLIERLPRELEELSKLEILDIKESINVPYWINQRPKLRLVHGP